MPVEAKLESLIQRTEAFLHSDKIKGNLVASSDIIRHLKGGNSCTPSRDKPALPRGLKIKIYRYMNARYPQVKSRRGHLHVWQIKGAPRCPQEDETR